MAKVTIEDISQATGLSRGTVSRALNNRPDISSATKQRVLEACIKLNYIPSYAARSLATGRTYAIAAVLSELTSPFALSVVRGLNSRAESERYMVNLVEVGFSPGTVRERLIQISPERVDGLVLISSVADIESTPLGEGKVVVSCWPVGAVQADVFTPDLVEVGRLAGRLLARAAGAVGVFLGGVAQDRHEQVRGGIAEAAARHGFAPLWVSLAPDTAREHFDRARDVLSRCSAAFVDSDLLAAKLSLYAARLGREVGKDLALISSGNTAIAQGLDPALTSIDWSGEEIGRRAMETILQRVSEQRFDSPQTTLIAPFLIERESSACLPASGAAPGF